MAAPAQQLEGEWTAYLGFPIYVHAKGFDIFQVDGDRPVARNIRTMVGVRQFVKGWRREERKG